MQTIKTDVLVVGGGGAGMHAALAAHRQGCSVLLAGAGSGGTAIAAGGFAAVLPNAAPGDSVEKHVEDLLQSALGLADERLVRILCENAPAAVEELMRLGVRFYRNVDGTPRLFRSGGHSYPRSLRCEGGNTVQYFRLLRRAVQDAGVKELRCTVTELLTRNGRVTGAAGVCGEGAVLLLSKAVVLATGGFGAAYLHTTNTAFTVGAGCQLAYEAGCALTDLEFVQFMPTTFAWPPQLRGRFVNDTLRGEGAVLRNRDGECFMERYDPRFRDCAARDILAYAIATEVAEGRGTPHGGVWLDARSIPRESLLASFTDAPKLTALGLDPSENLIEVTPASHFTCGGVRIDPDCFTGVEGLYAAGEATAGLYGANRLGANALPENVVFGGRAGASAAAYAQKNSLAPPPDHPAIEAVEAMSSGEAADEALDKELEAVRRLAWDHIGILRDAPCLAAGRDAFQTVAGELGPQPGLSLAANAKRASAAAMARLCAKAADAALKRAESRGVHRRSDFPEPAQALARHIVFAGPAQTEH